MITLNEDVLNRAWLHWNKTHNKRYDHYYHIVPYSMIARRGRSAQEFETMLFKEGATVQRINKKCYLQFTDAEEALMFRLKYV